jgi:hypothetical protein
MGYLSSVVCRSLLRVTSLGLYKPVQKQVYFHHTKIYPQLLNLSAKYEYWSAYISDPENFYPSILMDGILISHGTRTNQLDIFIYWSNIRHRIWTPGFKSSSSCIRYLSGNTAAPFTVTQWGRYRQFCVPEHSVQTFVVSDGLSPFPQIRAEALLLIKKCQMSKITVVKISISDRIWYLLKFYVNYTKANGKGHPCNRPWRPITIWDVEAPHLDNGLIYGGKFASLTCRPPFKPPPPPESSWYSILLETESTPGR